MLLYKMIPLVAERFCAQNCRQEVPGSIPGHACRSSRSDFFLFAQLQPFIFNIKILSTDNFANWADEKSKSVFRRVQDDYLTQTLVFFAGVEVKKINLWMKKWIHSYILWEYYSSFPIENGVYYTIGMLTQKYLDILRSK